MQVKTKSAQSGIGSITSDWELKQIEALIEDGSILGHLDGNHGELYPRSHEFKGYGIPYIGATDFLNGFVDFAECKHLAAARANQFRKGIAKNGDILFAHNATVGPVALLVTPLEFVILSTTATYFRCNPIKLDNIFLKYALQAQQFVRQYRAVMAQSTRFQVPITAQRKLFLTIPPLSEQRAIASALSDVDALINSLDRLIAKKEDMKQAAMQQLLTGKTRLPGFQRKDGFKHSEIGVIPEDWCISELREFARYENGKSYEDDIVKNGDYLLITLDSIGIDGKLKSQHKQIKLALDTLSKNDLVMILSDVAHGYFLGLTDVIPESGKYVLNQRVGALRSLRGTDPRYLSEFINSRQSYFKTCGQGSSQQNLAKKDILDFLVLVPSLPEQRAIAIVISDMDAEIAALEQRRDKTLQLKQGMMQELLTGRIRLI